MTLERGWHPDPTERFELRLWNGRAWTSQVHSNGVTSVDPFERAEPEAPAEPEEPSLLDLAHVEASSLRDEVAFFLPGGGRVATATEVSGGLAAAVEWLTKWDVAEDVWEVRDEAARLLLVLRKQPADAPLLVIAADGEPVGSVGIHLFGAPFTLRDTASQVGSITREGTVSLLRDAAGHRAGVYERSVLTIEREVDPVLRALAIAAFVAFRYDRTLE